MNTEGLSRDAVGDKGDMDDKKRVDLPQPGSDEPPSGDETEVSRDPTEGPGNVSVDEPTGPALDPTVGNEWEEHSSGARRPRD
jgi:hypothetical protein